MMRIAFLFILVGIMVSGQINLRLEAGMIYDSNPFSISDYEVDHPVGVANDFAATYSLRADTRVARFGRVSVRPSFMLSAENYFENTERSSISLRPGLLLIRPSFWVSSYYEYMPKKGIRPLKDAADGWRWKFPVYANNLFRVRSGWQFIDNTWAELSLTAQYRYFDQSFMEYDEDKYGYSVAVRHNDKYYLRLGYGYDVAECRGYNRQGETRETSDRSDASFVQDNFSLIVGRNFDNLQLRITTYMYLRHYTSEKPTNTYQYTRVDRYNSLGARLRYDFDDYYIDVRGLYMMRSVDSEIFAELSDLRRYERFKLEITMGWTGLRINY